MLYFEDHVRKSSQCNQCQQQKHATGTKSTGGNKLGYDWSWVFSWLVKNWNIMFALIGSNQFNQIFWAMFGLFQTERVRIPPSFGYCYNNETWRGIWDGQGGQHEMMASYDVKLRHDFRTATILDPPSWSKSLAAFTLINNKKGRAGRSPSLWIRL